MKAIDFTKPGGFPLTQDQIGYLQSAYTECINTLGALASYNNAPTILSGMVTTFPGGGVTDVSAGWFYYNGELIWFPSQSFPAVAPGNDMYVVITPSATPLSFYDGSTPNVILDKTGVLAELASTTPTDPTHFLLNTLIPYGISLGLKYRETVWNSMIVSTAPGAGGVTGTIFYKKNFLNNTLHIRASLGANNAQNFAASPFATYSLMGILPVGYIPNNTAYFEANYFLSGMVKDDLGIAWIKRVNCGVNTTGQLFVNWIKPDAAIGAYGIDFNTIIPLD